MIREINGMLKKISGLRKQIKKMRNTANRARNKIEKNINSSLPSFAQVLNNKIDASGEIDQSTNEVNQSVKSIQQTIETMSNREGIDQDLIRSVIQVESNFNPEAVSPDGARGLMQLMPDTADQLGVNPDNPKENIKGGVKYLGKLIDKYGNVREALAAYNAGPGAVDKHNGIPPYPETQEYVKKVLSNFRQIKQSGT